MPSLLLLIDGLGDEPLAYLNNKTPFEAASHPLFDKVGEQCSSSCSICEKDLTPESAGCIGRLLGLPKEALPRNRAYLEMLARGWDIAEDQQVWRCNLVAVDEEGGLAAFNGRGLSTVEMAAAARSCFHLDEAFILVFLSEYRNLLVVRRQKNGGGPFVPPPHEHVGEKMDELLAPLREGSPALAAFLQKAEERLRPFARGGCHYALYPWGLSEKQSLPSFSSLNGGRRGALVGKAEIVLGLAKAMGMEVREPSTATGDVDTDIFAKARAAAELLALYDVVVAHFNGGDEAAHRLDGKAKAAFISQIDSEFLAYAVTKFRKPFRIVVCGDHVTSSRTGKHGAGSVPVLAGVLNGPPLPAFRLDSYREIRNFLLEEEGKNG